MKRYLAIFAVWGALAGAPAVVEAVEPSISTSFSIAPAYPTSCTVGITRIGYPDYATHICQYGTGYITPYATCALNSYSTSQTVRGYTRVKSTYQVRVVATVTCPLGAAYLKATWIVKANL